VFLFYTKLAGTRDLLWAVGTAGTLAVYTNAKNALTTLPHLIFPHTPFPPFFLDIHFPFCYLRMHDGIENGLRRLRPDEGFGAGVVVVGKAGDGKFQFTGGTGAEQENFFCASDACRHIFL
jgi:hypothetical protein